LKKVSLIILAVIICASVFGCTVKDNTIVIGTMDYTEQYILGYMLSLYIEDNTNIKTTITVDLASDMIFAAVRAGVVDTYVDYTGTIYRYYFALSETGTAEEIFEITSNVVREDFDLHMFDPLGFNNTYQLAVRRDTAAEFNLRTISDLEGVSDDFIFGGSGDLIRRGDGLPNLKRIYNISFKEEIPLFGVDRYDAISRDEIQVVGAFSTDGHLVAHDLVILEDDKNFFSPYEGVIIIREETMDRFPELQRILGKLSGLITDEAMRELNYRVDILGNTPLEVAEYFLKKNNLIR